MELICILFIMIDLLLLRKLLEGKNLKPAVSYTVQIQERPRRVVYPVNVEEEPSLEELGEELRIKFKERLKDWEDGFLWNEEANLSRFRVKKGIKLDYVANNTNTEGSLFSLRVS